MTPRRVLAATAALAVSAALLSGCAVFDNLRGLTIAAVVNAEQGGRSSSSNPIETTDTVCGDDLDCVEAFTTDQADYVRFESRAAAQEYGDTLADGFVVDYIVMDFAGKSDAAKREQKWAMEVLAGTWQSYDGSVPER